MGRKATGVQLVNFITRVRERQLRLLYCYCGLWELLLRFVGTAAAVCGKCYCGLWALQEDDFGCGKLVMVVLPRGVLCGMASHRDLKAMQAHIQALRKSETEKR